MTATNHKPPYRRALLMAGGGLRFGYYLGIYQALCDTGKAPDLVIGTCGGAMASSLLLNALTAHHSSHRQAFLDVLSGRACYDAINSITDRPPKTYGQYLLPAMHRWIGCQAVKSAQKFFGKPILRTHLSKELIDSLSHHAIGHIHDEARIPYWQFCDNLNTSNTSTAVLILASRVIDTDDVTRWQGVLWASHPTLRQTIVKLSPTNVMAQYSSIIHPDYHLSSLPLSIMVRASMTDMYYLPPLRHDGEVLMGGVLDLTPIELACQLAQVVYAEPKSRFDRFLAEPAIYQAFGYLPNHRLDKVLSYMANSSQVRYLYTKDSRQLRPLIHKKPRLMQGYIKALHVDFDEFRQIMTEQFDYGYRVGLQSNE